MNVNILWIRIPTKARSLHPIPPALLFPGRMYACMFETNFRVCASASQLVSQHYKWLPMNCTIKCICLWPEQIKRKNVPCSTRHIFHFISLQCGLKQKDNQCSQNHSVLLEDHATPRLSTITREHGAKNVSSASLLTFAGVCRVQEIFSTCLLGETERQPCSFPYSQLLH